LLYGEQSNGVTFDLRSEINLHNITVAQHRIITRIRSVMCSNVIQRATSRKSDAGLSSIIW
jgi:hypothetical protein